jgi:hypothetical protein
MELQHLGQSRWAGGSEDTALIGGMPRIAQVEIVSQVMVRANEQEKTTAAG